MIYNSVIEGMTVNLRSVRPEDAEITYKMRADHNKTKYMHHVNGTMDDQRNYIIKQMNKSGDYLFLVTDKNNRAIGMRGIYNVTKDTAESGRTIGYGNAFQNMEALILGIDFAFDILGVHTVLMDAAAQNDSVRGIQIKLGAEEYRRGYLPGLEYEYIFSKLEYKNYINNRNKIMNMVAKYSRRR